MVSSSLAPPLHGHGRGHSGQRIFTAALLTASLLLATAIIISALTNHQNETNAYLDEDYFLNNDTTTPSTLATRILRHTPTSLRHRLLSSLSKSHHHKPLLPLDSTDYAGFFFSTLGLMIAAGGGIGGGGVLVPIYILVMGFSPKHAIPLSNITVFGGAVANTILNVKKRHPLADRPLVDWDLILVMEPLTIAGALMGAFLNKLLPEALLVVSLVALLSFTAYTTLKKAIRMYKTETRAMLAERGSARVREDGTKESELTRIAREQEEEQEEEEEEDSRVALLDDVETAEDEENAAAAKENEEDDDLSLFSSATDLKNKEQLQQILEEERHIKMGNVQVLLLLFVVILFINLMKGGGALKSPLGIRCGSNSFWIANGAMLGWILLISFFARSYLVRKHEIKEAVGFPYVEGDIKWDSRATIVYPVICAAAGFFAGMFGVGGGIVKGPLMLAMGVHPKVSSASSACMILFTSFTATTSFVVFGLLDMDYAAVCMSLGFVATLVGQIGLFYLMEKFQRNSYIAFSIGGIVLLSAFLMTIQSLISMVDSGGPRPPSGICTGKQ
mmetsp:Transcript_31492/g.64879  ORF Transcript_31492/g.64879 Transcript_31492/m.64879 type:complete len:560 (-) Transcript_31492:295-1974(-)